MKTPVRKQLRFATVRMAAAILLLTLWPMRLTAQFAFITNNGAITITHCSPDGSGNLTIPATINGLPVKALKGGTNNAYGLFDSMFTVHSVTIPEGVTDIEWAFVYCFNMFDVAIPSSVTNLGYGAFYHSQLRNVVIPDSVISIGDYAFWNSYGGLTNVTFGSNVQSIGNFAFSGCNRLLNVTIPASVTTVGIGAFGDSEGGLTNITVDAANPSYASVSGVLFNKNLTTLLQFPGGKSGSYVIPNGVTVISDYAFRGCRYLTNVIIPNGVQNIGDRVFDYSGLTSATLAASVTNLGPWAFAELNLKLYCPGNAPAADSTAFNYSSGAVYYLPGTSGWGTSLAGLPTAPWYLPSPLILNNTVRLQAPDNHFGFTVSWATNATVVVEACTNLNQPNWQSVQTNWLTAGTNYFTDPARTNFSNRFFRVRSE